MKKIWKSKGTIIGLAVVCVLVAGTCLIVRMKKDGGSFVPGKPPDETASEWNEADRPDKAETEAESSTGWQERETEETRQTENDDEVVIEFTTEPVQPETPEAPEPQGDLTDPSNPPTYEEEVEVSLPEETGSAPAESEEKPDPPAEQPSAGEPGSQEQPETDGVREDGAVYDPVFGWVVPSPITQIEGDSDGDPNKMVGNMD